MTESTIKEISSLMDGMYSTMSLQQEFLRQASRHLKEDNNIMEEYLEMQKDLEFQIERLKIRIESLQRLNASLNEENERLEKQNQELLRLSRS